MDAELLELLGNRVDFRKRSTDGEDDRGNPIGEWEPDLVDVPCRLEWLGGDENRRDRELTINSHRFIVNGGVAVTPAHRGFMDGREFEILTVGVRYDENGEEYHRVVRCEEIV